MCTRVGRLLALTLCTVMLSGECVFAQGALPGTTSNYAQGQISSIVGANSSNRFTVNRVNRNVLRQSVTRAGVRGVNQQNFLANTGPLNQPSSKPFSMIDRGPTVSPYLQLSNPLSTASDYYNVVRPLQEQRSTNDRVMRQQYAQSRKLNQLAAQGPFEITGNDNAAPTGHATGFMKFGSYMNTGGYFAPQTAPKQNR